MSTSVTESDDGKLFELYARYVGEPQSRKDVYGYWLFLFGAVVSFIGVVVYLLGPSSPSSPGQYVLREISTTLAAFGLPLALLGILLLLPVKRRGIQASTLGLLIAEGAVVAFVWAYPTNWTVGTPDYSAQIIAVYTVGTALVVGVAALVPVLTGEKSFFFEEEYERESEYPGTMVGELLHDGVFSVFKQDDEWQWRLIEQDARAGGTEGYLSRLEAEETVDRIRKVVGEAGLLELKNVAFRLYHAAENRWRWVLTGADGSVIAESQEPFEDRDSAAESVSELKELGPDAELLEIDGAAYEVAETEGGWTWNLLDEERNPLATGAGTYPDRDDAEAVTEQVSKTAAGADPLTIETYGIELLPDRAATDGGDAELADGEDTESDLPEPVEDDSDEQDELPETADQVPDETADRSIDPDDITGWRWRMVDTEGQELVRGTRQADSRRAAESTVYDLFEAIEDAPIMNGDEPTYEVVPLGDRWTWRLFDADEREIASPPSPMADAAGAKDGAEALRTGAEAADIIHIEEADFEYYPADDGWRWRLVTADRETLARSVGAHPDRESAAAAVEEIESQVGDADLIEYEDAAFQVYEAGEEWRWRLIDEDGNVMADSGAEFESRDDAFSSMMTVKENAPNAETLEIETAAFELYESDEEDAPPWNWRLVDRRGETTARGAGYESEAAARESMDRVRALADVSSRAMNTGAFQVYVSDEDWRWRYVTSEGAIIAESERSWTTRDEAETAIEDELQSIAGEATVHTVRDVAIETVEDAEGWTWRIRDPDRESLAKAATSYESRHAASNAANELQRDAGEFPVFALTGGAFVVTPETDGWAWRLVDDGWTSLAQSRNSHRDRKSATDAASRAGRLLPDAGLLEYEDAAFELYEESPGDAEDTLEAPGNEEIDGQAPSPEEARSTWNWRLVDEAGAVIAAGAGDYANRAEAANALEEVRAEVGDASVVEIDTAAFDLHRDEEGWRWRLVDEGGDPIAESLDAYSTRREAREAMDFVKDHAPDAVTSVAE